MVAPRTNAAHDQNFVPTLIGVSTADGTTPVPVEVNPATGAMITSTSLGGQLVTETFDYIEVTEAATTDTFQYKTGGSGGTLVATVVVTYTTTDKDVLDSVAKT